MRKLFSNKKYIAIAGGILVCLFAFMLFKHYSPSKAVGEEVTLVRAATIGSETVSQNYSYSGEVRGRYESQLAFQVGGKIVKRNVDLGNVVHAGDILMAIDAKDIQQTVNIGSAQVYSAQSQLKLAETNLNRYRRLFEQNAVSRMELDQYQNAYEAAVAAVRQASAQYTQGANQLDYSGLYADSDGVIAGINIEVGQVVGAGQPVVTLVRDGEREVEISVPENRIEEVRKASQLKIAFWALANVLVDGKIREIAPMADKVSRTYKVRISIPNAPPEIKLGMTASVTVGSGTQDPSVWIPLSAVYQNTDNSAVWVVNGETVSLRPVKLGAYGDAKIQVLSGLNPGDVVVLAGVHKLQEGQKVRTTSGSGL